MTEPLTYWPLVVYFGAILLVASAMLGGSWLLGEHHWERAPGELYESGIAATGSVRLRFLAIGPFYCLWLLIMVYRQPAVTTMTSAVAAPVGVAGFCILAVLTFVRWWLRAYPMPVIQLIQNTVNHCVWN